MKDKIENYSSTINPLLHVLNENENNLLSKINLNKKDTIDETSPKKNSQVIAKYKTVLLADGQKPRLVQKDSQDKDNNRLVLSIDYSESSNEKNNGNEKENSLLSKNFLINTDIIDEAAKRKNTQINAKYDTVLLADDQKSRIVQKESQDNDNNRLFFSIDYSESCNEANNGNNNQEIFDPFSIIFEQNKTGTFLSNGNIAGEIGITRAKPDTINISQNSKKQDHATPLVPQQRSSISNPIKLLKYKDVTIKEIQNFDAKCREITNKKEEEEKLHSRSSRNTLFDNNKGISSEERLKPPDKNHENFLSILQSNLGKKLINKRKIFENKKKRISMKQVKEDVNPLAIAEMLKKSEQNTLYGRIKLKLKQIDIIISCMLIVNLILSIVDNEIYITNSHQYLENYMLKHNIPKITIEVYQQMDKRDITRTENILRAINCLLSLTGAILLIIHYKYQVNLLQLDKKLSEFDSLFSSGLIGAMFLEILICIIFYPPGMNDIIIGKIFTLVYVYNWNSVISVIVMSKLFLILRVYQYCSRWTTDTADAICRNYKVKPGVHFAIKSELKNRPAFSLSILFFIVLGLLGFSMRNFEYGVSDEITGIDGRKGINDLQNLFNCLWLIIVTMTTVGYGDFYPRSHLGRIVGVLACIIGMLVLSLSVVFLSSISEFTTEEKKAYLKLKKLFAEDNIENKAACVIHSILLLRRHKTRKLENEDELVSNILIKEKFMLLVHLKKNISVFKNNDKVANSYALPVDEMLKRFENKLKEDIEKLFKHIGMLNEVDDELEVLAKNQSAIQKDLKTIMKMQNEVSQYLVNLNNEAFLANSMKKKLFGINSKGNDLLHQIRKSLTQVTYQSQSPKHKKSGGGNITNGEGHKKHMSVKFAMRKLKSKIKTDIFKSPPKIPRKKSCSTFFQLRRSSKRAKTENIPKEQIRGILVDGYRRSCDNEAQKKSFKKSKTLKFFVVREGGIIETECAPEKDLI